MKSKSTLGKMSITSIALAGLVAIVAVGCDRSSDPAGAAEDAVDHAADATRDAAAKADNAAEATADQIKRDRTAERMNEAAHDANKAIQDSKEKAAKDLQRGAEKANRELQETNR